MPWKCPVCGMENPDDTLYCTNCGAKKPENVTAQQQTPPQPEAQQPSQPPTEQQAPEQQPSPQPPVTPQPVEEKPPEQPQVPPSPPQPTTGKYYLVFIATPVDSLVKAKLPLDFETFPNISIGRSPENVIVIPDPTISRKHALISLENNEVYIEDLNSTNGTWLYDGKEFQPIKAKTKLENNAVLKLGNSTIVKFVKE